MKYKKMKKKKRAKRLTTRAITVVIEEGDEGRRNRQRLQEDVKSSWHMKRIMGRDGLRSRQGSLRTRHFALVEAHY